jgi:hypothetical protein
MKSYKWLLFSLFLLIPGNLVFASEQIAGIAIAKNDHVYVWHKDGMVTSGTSGHFEKYKHAYPYNLPPEKTVNDIVAISIAGSNDRVYAWYKDGTVSSGTTDDLDKYRAPSNYTLPPGKTTKSIVGIGIAKNDRVYTWYDDLTVSIGTADDLDKYRAPELFSLPIGKIASGIVEIDIAKSNDRVYVWYKDGLGSSGTSRHLDSYELSFSYIPSQVLYRWWGPGQLKLAGNFPTDEPIGGNYDLFEDLGKPDTRPTPKPSPKPDDDPADTGSSQSPDFSTPIMPNFKTSIDPMVAVGNQYLIVSDTGNLAFFDKQGKLLPEKNGIPGSISTKDFFQGFIAKTNADGSFNENNINLYMKFPKPCDSPDYPDVMKGNRFCMNTFYDTRVHFDPVSRRFFVIAQVRHPVWESDIPKMCISYTVDPAKVADTSKCDKKVLDETGKCSLATDQYCDLVRRYVVFAISKTEDPRDGFHQYIMTENNYRDYPWMAVNGNAFISAHRGDEDITGAVATIFSVNALKKGEKHPPYFRYYSKDVNNIRAVMSPSHHQNADGLVFLLGSKGNQLNIFAFQPMNDPWTAPPLLKTVVNFNHERPSVAGAVYRQNKLYLIDPYMVEEDSKSQRYSIRVVRIPIQKIGANTIQASKDSSKGYLDHFFGRNTDSDSSGDLISYERPSMAVNKNGDMLFGYGRYPFKTEKTLNPEARYTLWYANEPKQRRSHLLQKGEAANSRTVNTQIHYTTAVVDPTDDTSFWVALPFVDSNGKYQTVVAKISP